MGAATLLFVVGLLVGCLEGRLEVMSIDSADKSFSRLSDIKFDYLITGDLPYGKKIYGNLVFVSDPCDAEAVQNTVLPGDSGFLPSQQLFTFFRRSFECSFFQQVQNMIQLQS